jgi:hypothetical protein
MSTIKQNHNVITQGAFTISDPIELLKIKKTTPLDQFDFEQNNMRTWKIFLHGEVKKQPINPGWKTAAKKNLENHAIASVLDIPEDITVHQESLHALLRIISESSIYIVALN